MYLVSVEANQSQSCPRAICDLTFLSGVANHFVNVWLCHTLNPKAGRSDLKQPICTFVQHAPCPRTTDCVKVPWNLVSKDRWRYLGPNPKSCEMSDAPRVGFRADARSGWPCPLVESWLILMVENVATKNTQICCFQGVLTFPRLRTNFCFLAPQLGWSNLCRFSMQVQDWQNAWKFLPEKFQNILGISWGQEVFEAETRESPDS